MKYKLNKELRILRFFRLPINKVIIFISRMIFPLFFIYRLSNKKVIVTKEKIFSFDNKKITAYIFTPRGKSDTKLAGLVYFHGGGFIFKGGPYHYKLMKEYCYKANCKIIYIDYRLAYKYPYPYSEEDCYFGYKWVIENIDKLNISENKIAIGGDSAGGFLAITTISLLKLRLNIKPSLALLIYPVVDVKMNTKSMKEYNDTPMWNSKLNAKMWKYHLKENEIEKYQELISEDLFKEFPKTYLETAEFDCLKDEGIVLAEKLKLNGISVYLNNTQETVHGFDFLYKKNYVQQIIKTRINVLNK